MPSGADENDSLEKDEELAKSICSRNPGLGSGLKPARKVPAWDSGVPAQPLGFKFTSLWQKPGSDF